MNALTILELEYLYETVVTMTSVHQEPREAYSAKAKLKDMIDDYCEHSLKAFYRCCKCGEEVK